MVRFTLCLAAFAAFTLNADTRTHPGEARDYRTGRKLQVSGKAYARVFPMPGDCPLFERDQFLSDAQKALSTGGFVFVIPGDRASYGAVFCLNGYHGRIEPGLANTPDGAWVLPMPILMLAKQDRGKVGDYVKEILDSFESELRYLRSIDSEAFERVLDEWTRMRKAKPFAKELTTLLTGNPN